MYEIRDPIHKTIEFTEKEKMVIDHPYVQRLRFVRQLGMTWLVYPGAGHDRFSHAVGAMHVSGLIWKRIGETSGQILQRFFSDSELNYLREVLRFAALLHDLGHPPFSHVSEKFMPVLGKLELKREWFSSFLSKRQAKHEDYSVLLIAHMAKGPGAIFSQEEAQDIASLVHHDVLPSIAWRKKFGERTGRRGIHFLLRSLISGELDCDRMDYLLRDAHHTGVTYGYHDLEHIISNLGVTLDRSQNLILTLDSTAVRAFEDFLLARYHMFLQVYMHKTTLSFDYFLERAMVEGETGIIVPGNASGYVNLRDSTIIESVFTAAERRKNIWSRRLILRRPAKLVLSATHRAGKKLQQKLKQEFSKKNIRHFVVEAKQHLSRVGGKRGEHSNIMVRKKLFGKFLFEPVEHYSSLLKEYNQIIDITNLYVLREDWARSQKIISKLKPPKPSLL